MSKRKGGMRRKTRYQFRKHIDDRGKISLTKFMQKFNIGDYVHLTVEPAYQKGMYFPMFMGKTGTVKAQRGRCYEVQISDGNKQKILIVHPIHLKKLQ